MLPTSSQKGPPLPKANTSPSQHYDKRYDFRKLFHYPRPLPPELSNILLNPLCLSNQPRGYTAWGSNRSPSLRALAGLCNKLELDSANGPENAKGPKGFPPGRDAYLYPNSVR